MPNSIKGFTYVIKDGANVLTLTSLLYKMYYKYLLTDLQKNRLDKTQLKICYHVVVSKEVTKVFLLNLFKNFADCTEKRDWPVVGHIRWVIILIDWCDISLFPNMWHTFRT